jgi:DNA invertase Pin-like site-specific DNA recombinase
MDINALLAYEQWLPVVGYEAFYEVSNLGRVRSVGTGQGRRTGKILNQWRSGHGYMLVDLQVDLKAKSKLAHCLVAEAFLGPRPEKHDVDHIDGDRTNNVLLNLRYLTRSGNILARNERLREFGLRVTGDQTGESNPSSKLTEKQVEHIRALGAQGVIHERIAGIFGVRRETVGKILRNERWQTESQAEIQRQYDIRNGHRKGMTGKCNPMSKLSEEQVLEIRKLAAEGMVQRRIAEKFGIGPMQVSRIVSGKRWGWLDKNNVPDPGME